MALQEILAGSDPPCVSVWGHFGDISLESVTSLDFGLSGSYSEPSVCMVWVAALGLEGNSKRNTPGHEGISRLVKELPC